MPTYEYRCLACKKQFEREKKITESANTTCTHCGTNQVQRLISKTSFELKGKGWFKDGY